jgi:heme-degrading monooxygenase HmoA
MFVALYRWKIHADLEEEFIEAWSRISDLLLKERGSLGSRLHRGVIPPQKERV